MSFSQNDLVQVTREVEVTPGVVTGGARSRVYGTAPTWDPVGNTNKSGINTGEGAVNKVRAGLRAATAGVPSELVYELNHLELEDFFRDTFPASEVTLTDVSVTFANAGTQLTTGEGGLGGTGPIITAAAGVFDDIYNADHQGCMLEISGSGVNADNRWARGIYAAKSDGTQIDLMPEYVNGSAGAFGSPLIDEGPVTATLKIGKPIKNMGISNIRYVNFEYDFTDQSGGSFEMVRGCKAGTFKLALDGKGNMTLEVGYEAMDYDNPTEATQGNGTVNANAAIDNDNMTSAEDLAYFVVNGSTVLSSDNLTNWNCDGNGSASGIDNTAGSRSRPGVTVGDIDFTGSMKIYHEHTKMKVVSQLARAGSRVPLALKVMDPAGNFYWFHLPRTLFEPGGPKPGAKGSLTDGTFNYMTQMGPGSMRTGILQAFAA